MPFLAEHLWRTLVRTVRRRAGVRVPRRLARGGRARRAAARRGRTTCRRVVELGRQARAASQLKLRQPLPRLVVDGAPLARGARRRRSPTSFASRTSRSARSRRGAAREAEPAPARTEARSRARRRCVRRCRRGAFEDLGDGRFRAAGHELEPDEVLVERTGREGWAVASDDGVTVALDTAVDAALELEGRVYELIHAVNTLRKELGLELSDRIRLTVPATRRRPARAPRLDRQRDARGRRLARTATMLRIERAPRHAQ